MWLGVTRGGRCIGGFLGKSPLISWMKTTWTSESRDLLFLYLRFRDTTRSSLLSAFVFFSIVFRVYGVDPHSHVDLFSFCIPCFASRTLRLPFVYFRHLPLKVSSIHVDFFHERILTVRAAMSNPLGDRTQAAELKFCHDIDKVPNKTVRKCLIRDKKTVGDNKVVRSTVSGNRGM